MSKFAVMNDQTELKEIKIIVAQTTSIRQENLGDGDDGFQITTRYLLLSNKTMLFFSRESWIKALYLCQCELESKEYFLLNHISGEESTISFDVNHGNYVQLHPVSKYTFTPIESDLFSPEFYINPFKTQRICDILQRYDNNNIYVGAISESNVIPKNQWDNRTPIDLSQTECNYTIDLIRDSNIGQFSLPEAITNHNLNVYLCIPTEYIESYNEIIYYLAFNIANAIDFIPEEIRKDLYNYIGCKTWEQIHNGDIIKGQKVCHVVEMINEAIKKWGYIGPTITFHVGNELVCQYKVSIDDLIQKIVVLRYSIR